MSLTVLWKCVGTAVLSIGPALNRRSSLAVFTLGKKKTVKLSVFQQGTLCFRYCNSRRFFLFLIWMNLSNSHEDRLRTSTYLIWVMCCVSQVRKYTEKWINPTYTDSSATLDLNWSTSTHFEHSDWYEQLENFKFKQTCILLLNVLLFNEILTRGWWSSAL
jgi:hypothetical protein